MKPSMATDSTKKNILTSSSKVWLSLNDTSIENLSQWPACCTDLGPSLINSTKALSSGVKLACSSTTPFTSFSNCSEPYNGGGPGRNWSEVSSKSGVTSCQ